MELFRARAEDFTAECRMRVEELRNRMKEVWSLYPISSYNYEYLINLSISPCCCTYGTNIYILFMIEIFPKLHNILLRKLRQFCIINLCLSLTQFSRYSRVMCVCASFSLYILQSGSGKQWILGLVITRVCAFHQKTMISIE